LEVVNEVDHHFLILNNIGNLLWLIKMPHLEQD